MPRKAVWSSAVRSSGRPPAAPIAATATRTSATTRAPSSASGSRRASTLLTGRLLLQLLDHQAKLRQAVGHQLLLELEGLDDVGVREVHLVDELALQRGELLEQLRHLFELLADPVLDLLHGHVLLVDPGQLGLQ